MMPLDNLPAVSIITPSFNQGRFIRDTIESVLSQDYPRLAYIGMDGGSTDETIGILRSYGDRLIWKSALGQGQAVLFRLTPHASRPFRPFPRTVSTARASSRPLPTHAA